MVNDAPGGGAVVFGEVQCIHLDDRIYQDSYIQLAAYRPIGRLAGAGYTRVTDLFSLSRVPPPTEG